MADLIRAAGAVLWRPGPEILLVHRPRYDDWSLPKGKQEHGEHILITAVREVQEEASVRPVLGPRLRTVSYEVHGEPKQVGYWQARAADATADNEIDAVEWLPFDKALDRISYPHDKGVVLDLVPVETVPLILLRHAKAGPKGGNDLRRPLDAHGERDAATLAVLLACFAPRARVLSSPADRCTQTVRPYTEAAGVPLETDASLQTHLSRTPGGSRPGSLLRGIVAARQPTVVCLHRENLAEALAAACAQLGAEPPRDPALHKGSFWVLHMAAGRLVAMERYDCSPAGSTLTAGSAGSAGTGLRRRPTSRQATKPTSSTASTIRTYSEYLFTSE
jgi:8-oxo-dGTP pyrophosphatase MutT (NUDIX family)/phosphohistidine phosphatase SixA